MPSTGTSLSIRIPPEWVPMLVEASGNDVTGYVRTIVQRSLQRNGFPAEKFKDKRGGRRKPLRDDVQPRQMKIRKKRRRREQLKEAQAAFRTRVMKAKEVGKLHPPPPPVNFSFPSHGSVVSSDIEATSCGYMTATGKWDSTTRHGKTAIWEALKQCDLDKLDVRYRKFIQRMEMERPS